MPNYYAHLQFGAQVLAALPRDLRARLEEEQEAYTLGQYGPDPLYFYFAAHGGPVRALGHTLHRQPARQVIKRLRRAAEEERPFAAGYAAGFLCHFALDSRCHPWIEERLKDSPMTHGSIESEFDRFLMVRDGVDPASETPLPTPQMPAAFYRLLEQCVYPGMTGEQYRKGLGFYRKISGWHTRMAGSRGAGRCFDLAARLSKCGTVLGDMVLKREPALAQAGCNGELLELLQDEVPATAAQLSAFFAGEPLGLWFDRDFYGKYHDH